MPTVEQLQIAYSSDVAAKATADKTALEGMAAGAEKAGKGVETVDTAIKRANASFESSNRLIDGAAAAATKLETANQRLQDRIRTVNQEVAKGNLTVEAAAAKILRLTQVRDQDAAKAEEYGKRLERSFAPATATTNQLTASTGQATFAMRQFGVQSVQAISGIATGQSVMMVLIQQGHQLVDVALATGTGFGVLGQAIKNAMLAVISPTGLAVTAIAGLAAATYIAVNRSSDMEARQRELAVSLAATGRTADVSAASLQRYADQLTRAGVSRADSQSIVNQLGRNQNLSASQIGQIAGIAPDLGAAMGTDAKSAISGLEQIAGGSADAIRKLNDEFHVLTPAQEAAAAAAVTHGHAAEALSTVIDKLRERMTGLHEQALSPTAKTMTELGNAWDDFASAIVKSAPVQAQLQGWANILQSIANSVKGIGGTDISSQIVALTNKQLGLQQDLQKNPAGRLSEMVGLDTRQQQLKEVEDQILNLQDQSRKAANAVSVGPAASLPGDLYGPSPPSTLQRSLDISRSAASRAESSNPGQIAKYKDEIRDFRTELTALGPRTAENAKEFDNLTGAITADQKAIDDLTKKNEVHRTGLQKQLDELKSQITAQNQLATAYGQGVSAVEKVLAVQAAEKQAITDGLTPGTAKYAAAVKELTARHIDLAHATAESDFAKQTAANNNALQLIQAETSSIGMNNDARALMLDHLKHEQELKDKGISVESDLGKAYLDSTDALIKQRQALANQQQSYQALADIGATAFDRLGQSISDAFLSGSGQAVNFGNIIKAVMGSVITDLLKLAVINPILNEVFSGGATRPTLTAALGGAAGASGSSSGGFSLGSLYQLGSGASSISGALGGPSLSSIGNSLGLTGNGGYFSGIGSTVNGYLATPIYGGSTMTGLTGEAAAYGAQGGGALTVGGALGALGGIGAGYGIGTTVGGFTAGGRKSGQQNAQIGSIVGSVAGAYFGPLGSIAGGAIGGAIGGMLGPANASPYSLTNIGVGQDGRLTVGSEANQISGGNKSQVQAEVDQFNATLALAGVRIANKSLGAGLGSIGSEEKNPTHAGTNFAGASVGDLFNTFKYSSDDPHVNAYLTANGGAGFSDLQTMATVLSGVQAFVASVSNTEFASNIDSVLSIAEAMGANGGAFLANVSTFVNQTVPALTTASKITGSLTDAVQALTDTYAPAIITAQQLGYKEQELTDARDKSITAAVGVAQEQGRLADAALVGRFMTARATNDNSTPEAQQAALYNFDLQADAQRKAFLDGLVATYGDSYKDTQQYADQIVYIEQTLGEERLTVQKQYNDAITKSASDAAAAAGDNIVSISDYIKKFSSGSASPLSANAQFDIASRQFDSVANSAIGGNFAASQQFTTYADSLATSARTVYGSGAGYAAVVDRIITAANQIASQGSDLLTSSVQRAEIRTQTQILGEKLDTLTAEVSLLRQQTQQAANIPARAA